MRHTSLLQLAVVATALSGAAASALAQPAGGEGPGRPQVGKLGPPDDGFARELGLSAAQQQQVREILEARRPEREALHDKITANREQLQRLLESGSADANAVGELVLEGRRLHEQSRALREAQQKAIRDSLTPEQQKKFDTMQQRRRERRPGGGEWPGKPGAPGGAPGGVGGQRGPGGPGGPGPGSGAVGSQPFDLDLVDDDVLPIC